MASHSKLPEAALTWLIGAEPVRVVALACPRSIIHELVAKGHGVAAVEEEWIRAHKLAALYPHSEQVVAMVGEPQNLPLTPCSAHVVLVGQGCDTSPTQIQSQISRSLQPGGWAAGWQIVRDDSVPWVQRLIEVMRSVDADAMQSTDLETGSLVDSKYFPRVETRDFRLWLPITRAQVRAMVESAPAVAALPDVERTKVMARADAVFDGVGRTSEMQLPYQLHCWRAHVDHEELTVPITLGDGALHIII
ncbi:hypothetical protein HMPREF1531_01287 [Propionibacterium sp. oral taxon 192 str. F0372]|uniref:hypothetical protein n=1 Tax=Propionibacterium sp. oral taxon 192 TaxID=671222 RepID=UPI00035307B4|nr:hypothetical protein [Propionibacterium sp. oral taxon 192]EPH03229.1 hypothetical protein HMPREF1531_01287 [Propionibacterium sp. oral taxon 192 str. F0372]